MTLDVVRSYFRSRANEQSGWSEWTDGFNTENIPSSILDKKYHLGVPSISPSLIEQRDLTASASISIEAFFKGYRDPATCIDTAVSQTQAFIKTCLKASNRCTFINVSLNGLDFEALNADNDNHVKATVSFLVELSIDPES